MIGFLPLHILKYFKINSICYVMVCVFASSAGIRGLEPQLGLNHIL